MIISRSETTSVIFELYFWRKSLLAWPAFGSLNFNFKRKMSKIAGNVIYIFVVDRYFGGFLSHAINRDRFHFLKWRAIINNCIGFFRLQCGGCGGLYFNLAIMASKVWSGGGNTHCHLCVTFTLVEGGNSCTKSSKVGSGSHRLTRLRCLQFSTKAFINTASATESIEAKFISETCLYELAMAYHIWKEHALGNAGLTERSVFQDL